MAKVRLDELLVARGLVETRSLAKSLIMAGKIRSKDQVLDKPGKSFSEDIPLELEQPYPYVGRGAEKIKGAIEFFQLPVEGKTVLDVGASTGGFTDYLLQHGALDATCVDVGHGQLHYKLQKDERVTNLEKMNARTLDQETLPREVYDFVVMDLSFISLTKVLPATWLRVGKGGHLICLVKPQFEAQKKEVDAGKGIIRSEEIQQRTLQEIISFVKEHFPDAEIVGSIDSPIKGGDGNKEFLLCLHRP